MKEKFKLVWLFIGVATATFFLSVSFVFLLRWIGHKTVFNKIVSQSSSVEDEWWQRNKEKPFVELLMEYKCEIKEAERFSLMHQVILVQTDEAKSLGEWKEEYSRNSEKIVELKATVRTKDGRVLKPSMIQDRNKAEEGDAYSDAREKVLTLPEVVPGSIIEIWCKKRSKFSLNKISYVFPLRFYCPIKLLRVEIFVFGKDKFRMLSRNTAIRPKISSAGSKSVYLWQRECIDGYIKEKYSPPEGELSEEVIFSSFKSWDEVGSLFKKIYDKKLDLTGKMFSIVQELTANKKTEIEKINAVLRYVSSQLRYVSIDDSSHFIDSRKASVIFDQKFGNCEEYTVLARALLKVAGITSYPVLVCDYEKGNPADKLPGFYFNHLILGLQLDGKYYFADPQIPGYQLNETPSPLSGAYIFVLSDKPFLSQLSFAPTSELKKEIRVSLKSDGSGLVREIEDLDRKDAIGYELQLQKKQQKEADITSSFSSRLGIRLIERKVVLQKDGSVKFNTVFEDNWFGHISGEMIMFGLGPSVLNFLPLERKERQLPLDVWGKGISWITRAVYEMPQGYEVAHIPGNYELTNDFITLSRRYYPYDKNTIIELETIIAKPCRLPASEYKQLIASLDAMVYASRDLISIQKQKSKPIFLSPKKRTNAR
jgi:hypothetical protein